MTRDPKWRGIEKHGSGYRAVVSRGTQGRVCNYYPKGTSPAVMQRWREDTKAASRVARKPRASRGTFEGDAKRYLAAVVGLADYASRQREIGLWVQVFKTRARDSITSADIRAQRDQWMTTPRATHPTQKRTKPVPVSPATINKRLRALSNLYRVLDGSQAHNPVRDVPELREPARRQRTLTHDDLRKIIAALSDRGTAPKKGAKRLPYSPTKIRIRCLSFCQITPKQLGQLTPDDVDLAGKRLHLPARAKGHGAQDIWVDLVPEAVAAFTDFHQKQLYGPFSQHSLRKAWQRAAKKAGIVHARPYDSRHAFGAFIYRATKSRAAVSQLLQHASWDTSSIYAGAAEDDVRSAHSKAVVETFGGSATRDPEIH